MNLRSGAALPMLLVISILGSNTASTPAITTMPLQLSLTTATHIPLEVEGLIPAALQAMSRAEIERFSIFHGNAKVPLAEFFSVTGDIADGTLVFRGDLSGVHWIGAKMASGTIRIEGRAGRHVGSQMRGGEILVAGDAGDWVGAEMRGGRIDVRGSAGHLVGGAYRGSSKGMTKGTILIRGSAGSEVGHTMRRGLIAIGGDCGDFAGFSMLAGTILVAGKPGIRHGANMRRGTIGFLGTDPPPMLPSFRRTCRCRPTMLRLLWKELDRRGFPIAREAMTSEYEMYAGDLNEGGRGEVFLRVT